MILEDTFKHKGQRKSLVNELANKGIHDLNVLSSIGIVPRHFFFDKIFNEHAYQDKAFPIGEGQTISQPYTVAFQTQTLEIKKGDKVLEIGTGSGYQCCVLIELGAQVVTIETQRVLYEKTRNFLPKIGYNAIFLFGDGTLGAQDYAPFDKIIVTAGAPSIPDSLIDQLKIGGKLVIPVGTDKTQKMIKLTRIDNKLVEKEEYGIFSFVPLIGENGWKDQI